MLERSAMYEAMYRRRLAAATALSLFASVVTWLVWLQTGDFARRPARRDELRLGYPGPTRAQIALEVYEPNSVQSYFHQKAREGRARAIEYRVLQPLELLPGPQATFPERETRPMRPREEPTPEYVPEEAPDIVEPLPALQAPLSTSEELQILRLVKPIYPEYELERGISARVLVAFYVAPDNQIEDAQVQEAITVPPAASSRGFELAVLEALGKWIVRLPPQYENVSGTWKYVWFTFDPVEEVQIDLGVSDAP